jgi:hypothetical protein
MNCIQVPPQGQPDFVNGNSPLTENRQKPTQPTTFLNIPSPVAERADLSPGTKLVFGAIQALCLASRGQCDASVAYLAKKTGLSIKQVGRALVILKDKALIVRSGDAIKVLIGQPARDKMSPSRDKLSTERGTNCPPQKTGDGEEETTTEKPSSSFSLPAGGNPSMEVRDAEPEKPPAEALDIQSGLVERVAAMGLKESRHSPALIDRARACKLLDQAIAHYGLRWVVWAVTMAASRANIAKGRKPVETWAYVTSVLAAWRSGSSVAPSGWPDPPGGREEAPSQPSVVIPPATEETEQVHEWWAELEAQYPGLRLAVARERAKEGRK